MTMKPRHKRFILVAAGVAALAGAAGLVLSAFQQNLVFFFTPTQVAANEAPDGVTVQFVVTDTVKTVAVEYRGPLPDLFREGKGVVTQGKLGPDGLFRADEVLAKHDENYMPPEAKHALDQAGKAEKTLVR